MASRKPLGMWSLTIRDNYVPLPGIPRMKDVFSEFARSWVFQKECGHNAHKDHYQARLILEDKQTTETMLTVFECRGFDRRDLTFRPESNNSVQQGGLSFYVMKDDTRVDGPWYDPSFKQPKKRKVYEGRDLQCVIDHPRDFQAEIIRRITAPPDTRCIDWVWNQSGCAGKSVLMKYLVFKEFDVCRVPLGSATQIKTSVVEKANQNGGGSRTYMVDLPRVRGNDERANELFSAIEEIKTGWVETAMYGKPQSLFMEPPHVWVFSNELPHPGLASADRWRIHTVTVNAELRTLTRSEWKDYFTQQLAAAKQGPSFD